MLRTATYSNEAAEDPSPLIGKEPLARPQAGVSWEARLAGFNRQPRRWLVLLALLLTVQVSPYWYPTPDASAYLSIARNLAAGRGLANLGSRQLYLAPGYSVLISPAFWVSPKPFLLLSVLHWALAVTFMVGVYRWVRGRFPEAAVLLTALAVINVEVLALYRRTLSEAAFMVLLIWLIALLQDLADTARRPKLGKVFLAAFLMAALACIRQAGLTVAAGFGCVMLLAAWKRRQPWTRSVGIILAVGVPAGGMVATLALYDRAMAQTSGFPTYLDHLVDPTLSRAGQVAEGLRLRLAEVGRLTIPGMFKAYGKRGEWLNGNMAVYGPLFALVLAGGVGLVRRRMDVLALTFPFYLGLYVVWPFDQATRFLVPMVPLLWACLWVMIEPWRQWRLRVLGLLLAAHFVVAFGYWAAIDWPRARQENAGWSDLDALAAHLPPQSTGVIGSAVPGNTTWMVQFLLDRRIREQSEVPPWDADVQWLITRLDKPLSAGYFVQASAGRFQLVRRDALLAGALPTKNPSLRIPVREGERGVGRQPRLSDGAAAGVNWLGDDRGRRRFGAFLAVDRVIDFLAVDRDLLGGDNAKADFIPPDFHYRDGNIIVDDDAFVFFPGQY
jgi:hypothetical protein